MNTEDLNGVRAEAAAVDAEVIESVAAASPEAAGGEPPQPPVADPVAEARGLVDTLIAVAVPFFPGLDQVYTPEARQRLAEAAGPLMAKYNFTVGGLFDKWKEEINFGFVALPLVLQTVRVITAQRAAAAIAAKAAQTDKLSIAEASAASAPAA